MKEISPSPAVEILSNLEEDIRTVLDASLPNKQQHRAAIVLVSGHFWRARHLYEEAVSK